MKYFLKAVKSLFALTGADDVHELGCGEGKLVLELAHYAPSVKFRACDLSSQIIQIAETNIENAGFDIPLRVTSIYDLQPEVDAASLIVCCEVLEHLPDPEAAVKTIASLAKPYAIVSTPREPLWRMLNMLRGRYISRWGNTPGHIQHWSRRGLIRLIHPHMEVVKVLSPLPWTVLLCRVRDTPMDKT